jgi:lipopolysaccharide biosynthesis glycosyltransferase
MNVLYIRVNEEQTIHLKNQKASLITTMVMNEWMNFLVGFFLKELLPDVDSVIYVDTDVIFLRPVLEMWNLFAKFSEEQLMAMARETEGLTKFYYATKRIPFVPLTG